MFNKESAVTFVYVQEKYAHKKQNKPNTEKDTMFDAGVMIILQS